MTRRAAQADAELTDPLSAHKAARAEHDAAIKALKAATSGLEPPDPQVVDRQAAAARAEIRALDALRRRDWQASGTSREPGALAAKPGRSPPSA